MPLRWSHAVLHVRDVETMLDFYTRVLGFEVTDRGPLGEGAGAPEIIFMSQVPTDHHQLAFLSAGRGAGRSNTHHHMAFRVSSYDEVRAFAQALERDGRATEIEPVTHGNAWSVYFRDPEDNGVEIFCDSPFHVSQPKYQPLDISLDEQQQRARTVDQFGDDEEFDAIDAWYAKRAEELGRRES